MSRKAIAKQPSKPEAPDVCSPELVRSILEHESVAVVFHPICSIRKRGVVGFEALTRGIEPGTGAMVRPDLMFTVAKATGQAIELDRLCRSKALSAFKPMHDMSPEWTLFINFDTSIIDEGVVGSGVFLSQVLAAGLSPERVVTEIIESRVHEIGDLQSFVAAHKDHGFLVAIDDLGAGYSNLERISALQPGVIKIDRALAQNIEARYHKQEIFRSLVNIGHKLGSVVLAEGVESEAQCMQCLELGADLVQGFYFQKPATVGHLHLPEAEAKAAALAADFRAKSLRETKDARVLEARHREIVTGMCAQVETAPLALVDEVLADIIAPQTMVECAYILNSRGIQQSGTVFHRDAPRLSSRFIFYPAEPGTDHSMKEYFMQVHAGLDSYFSPPYISLATGSRCRTLAHKFNHERLGPSILCVDFRPE